MKNQLLLYIMLGYYEPHNQFQMTGLLTIGHVCGLAATVSRLTWTCVRNSCAWQANKGKHRAEHEGGGALVLGKTSWKLDSVLDLATIDLTTHTPPD